MNRKIEALLGFIYGERAGEAIERLAPVLERAKPRLSPPPRYKGGFPLNEGDSILITYADQFREGSRPALVVLKDFLDTYLKKTIRGVHILPFAPYSSDDGFSVIDFRAIHPGWGTWDDVRAIAKDYIFMTDLVLNHCSRESEWFKAFLRDEAPYRDYFITVPPGTDVSSVFRPRTNPLLTEFTAATGPKLVWTTFSEDQVDLNYANPAVLAEMVSVFLFYAEVGARIIRLDAIAYLWKELGTPCLHHPKTHAVVKLFRAIAEELCPWLLIITETNVPQEENFSYFGSGDEAQMVYQFALPPLILHAFMKGDSSFLQKWASGIKLPGPGRTFFNFCASHDGIGILPARGILPDSELEAVFLQVRKRRGYISYKSTPSGDIPYELNINYKSAIAEATLSDSLRARKFLASQAVLLAMPGVPGLYVHSVLGSENWVKGVAESGIKRRVNRQKLDYPAFRRELAALDSPREDVFFGFEVLLEARAAERALHPFAEFSVVPTEKECFVVLRVRRPEDGGQRLLCAANLTPKEIDVAFSAKAIGMVESNCFTDIINGSIFYPTWETMDRFSFTLRAFEVMWLRFL